MKLVSALYLLGVWFYTMCLHIASLFNNKAKLLCKGRSETWTRLSQAGDLTGCVWVHAASLGEFEQGRPLIERLKKQNPNQKVVLTFYSPSGYEVRKNYAMADVVCYLPADTPSNAKRLVETIKPRAVFFVKYEFWHFFLSAVRKNNVPLYGVSMIFRPQQPFFHSFGDWFRAMLRLFTHIYVQDEASGKLLSSINVTNYSVVGDTRFDRVKEIAQSAAEVSSIATFVAGAEQVMVAGSTWPPDEDILVPFVCSESQKRNLKMVIAPHEIAKTRVDALCQRLTVPYVRFTELDKLGADLDKRLSEAKVFVVDTIGILSAIYRYGTMTYVGGGFGVGIHNTLEPAIYGLPVFFGPNHQRFKEACDLKACGGGFTFSNADEFNVLVSKLLTDAETLKAAGKAAGDYCESMLGATDRIMQDTQALWQ